MLRLTDLNMMLAQSVSNGAASLEVYYGPALLTKQQAYLKYGRSLVDRWILENLVSTSQKKNSNKFFIDSKQLEAVAAKSNRITYLRTAER